MTESAISAPRGIQPSPLSRGLLSADGYGPLILRWVALALILLLAEALVTSGRVSALFLAAPSSVAQAFWALLPTQLVRLTVVTLLETAAAMVLAGALGVVAGYSLWRFRALGVAYETLLAAVFASPIVLLYPITLVFFGRTSFAVIAMATVVAIIPIVLGTRQALATVNSALVRYGRTLQMSEREIFREILMPAAAPGVFTGLRLGLIYMLKAILAMEFIVNIGGVGSLVAAAYDFLRMPDLYAGIVSVIGLSVLFMLLLARGERYVRYGT